MGQPRVMFVDDDPEILRALKRVLRKHRDRWEMVFALGGPAALDEVRRAPFDVVVTDMRMPTIDGAALLLHVRERDPTTFRMILSGFSDQSAVTRVLPLAHQFFDKPCEVKSLSEAIDRACRLRAVFVDPRLHAVAERVTNLPPPRLYHELMGFHGRPDRDAIVGVLARHPVIAARILRVATGMATIEDVAELGPGACAGLSLFAHVLETLGQPIALLDLESLEHRAFDAARRAGSEAFTAALVRELGIALIAAGMPTEHAAIVTALEQSGAERAALEREILGATHAEVAAYMLAQWCIPLEIVEAVAFETS